VNKTDEEKHQEIKSGGGHKRKQVEFRVKKVRVFTSHIYATSCLGQPAACGLFSSFGRTRTLLRGRFYCTVGIVLLIRTVQIS
jgi:hypothetical protein